MLPDAYGCGGRNGASGISAEPVLLDHPGDDAVDCAGIGIDPRDLQTDGIVFVRRLLHGVHDGLDVHARLKTYEDELVPDAGDSAEVVAADLELFDRFAFRVVVCRFDGQRYPIQLCLRILFDCQDACNDDIAGAVQITDIREPLPGSFISEDLAVNAERLDRDAVVRDADNAAGNEDALFDTAGFIIALLEFEKGGAPASDGSFVLQIQARDRKVDCRAEDAVEPKLMLQSHVVDGRPIGGI